MARINVAIDVVASVEARSYKHARNQNEAVTLAYIFEACRAGHSVDILEICARRIAAVNDADAKDSWALADMTCDPWLGSKLDILDVEVVASVARTKNHLNKLMKATDVAIAGDYPPASPHRDRHGPGHEVGISNRKRAKDRPNGAASHRKADSTPSKAPSNKGSGKGGAQFT